MTKRLLQIVVSLLLIFTLVVALASCDMLPDEVKDMLGIGEEKPEPEKPEPENPEPENPDPENPDPDNPDPETPKPTYGNGIGDLAYDAEIALAEGDGTVRISSLYGKVIVINFWGTWCNPCTSELPHFDSVAEEYSESVAVVAIHSSFDDMGMSSFIGKNYGNSEIIFAQDTPIEGENYKDTYYTLLGGKSAYPYTVILDAEGKITLKKSGIMSYDELTAAVIAAGASAPAACTHENAVWVTETEPTCKAAGVEKLTCPDCKETTNTREIPKLTEHTPAKEPVTESFVDSTCSLEGSYKLVTYCAVCDAPISQENKTIPKKDHTPKKEPVTEDYNDSTCETEGSYKLVTYCAVCDEPISSENKTVDKKPHTPADTWITDVEPTCQTAGSQHKECTVCHLPLETEELPIVDHSYENLSCIWCSTPYISGGLEFEIEDETTCSVIGIGDCEDKIIVIPSVSPDGYTVTAIGNGAFQGEDITAVIMPDSITKIYDDAFRDCSALESLTLSANLEKIYANVFWGCGSSDMGAITLPATLTYLAPGAFYGSSFSSISFAEGSQIKMIPDSTFAECPYLSEVNLPDSMTAIGSGVFGRSPSLLSINVPESNTGFKTVGGALLTKDGTGLVAYPAGITEESYTAPAGVTGISPYAFYYNQNLKSVTFPSTVVNIYASAFEGAYNLESVNLESATVELIGNKAFAYCESLKSINTECVLSFGNQAFTGCRSLTGIELDAATSLGESVFEGCSSLITTEDSLNYVDGWVVGGSYAAAYAIKDGTVGISLCGLPATDATGLVIPSTVKYIGAYAIPSTVTVLYYRGTADEWAEVVTADDVTAEICFYSEDMPAVSGFFWHYTEDGTVEVWPEIADESVFTYEIIENYAYIKKYTGGTKYTDLVVPSTLGGYPVREVMTEAFYWNSTLKSVRFLGNLQILKDMSFYSCSNLEKIYLPESIRIASAGAFVDNYALIAIEIDPDCESYQSIDGMIYSKDGSTFIFRPNGHNYIKEFIIPDHVVSIAAGAFTKSHIGKIYIPAGVGYIAEDAFGRVTSAMSSFVVAEGNTAYKAVDGHLFTYDGKVLLRYAPSVWLDCYTIPEGVERIATYAFHGTSGLKKVVVPASVREICDFAFMNATALANVEFEEGVLTIGKLAFSNTALNYIVLPDSVESIGEMAFYYNPNLIEIHLGANLKYIGRQAFWYVAKLQYLIFDKECRTGWVCSESADFTTVIEVPESELQTGQFASEFAADYPHHYWRRNVQ